MSWIGNYNDKIFWFDTETTGLDEKKNGIIQLACVVEICGEIQEKREFKMNPLRYKPEVSEGAIAVHGITLDEIKSYPDAMQVATELQELFDKYTDKFKKNDKFWVGGQNVKFDIGFLYNLWIDFKGEDKAGYLFSHLRGGAYLDTTSLASTLQAMQVLPVTPDRKLQTLTSQVGMDFSKEDAHDAVADVLATRELFYKYMDILEVPRPVYKIHESNLL